MSAQGNTNTDLSELDQQYQMLSQEYNTMLSDISNKNANVTIDNKYNNKFVSFNDIKAM